MKYEQVALNYLLPFDSYKISDCNFKKYDIKTYNIDQNKLFLVLGDKTRLLLYS